MSGDPGRYPTRAGVVERAAAVVAGRWEAGGAGTAERRLALVLGSGLGGLADRLESPVPVPYRQIDGWPVSGIAGHVGRLVAGRLAGVPVVALQGRVHLYEGYPARRLAFPIRVLAALGVGVLFVSNAAGAVHRDFRPGDLMLIRDHLNLMWRNPLAGSRVGDEPRRPDMHAAYDSHLSEAVRKAAEEEGILLREGVYAGLLGPSYETPAEIRMVERLGADAVGMSTVPEVVAARAAGLRCFGVSCLTNYAAGLGREPLSHADVLEVTERSAGRFRRLVTGAVRRLGTAGGLSAGEPGSP